MKALLKNEDDLLSPPGLAFGRHYLCTSEFGLADILPPPKFGTYVCNIQCNLTNSTAMSCVQAFEAGESATKALLKNEDDLLQQEHAAERTKVQHPTFLKLGRIIKSRSRPYSYLLGSGLVQHPTLLNLIYNVLLLIR